MNTNNKTNQKIKSPKVGIVFGGGDCSGLNTALDALVKGFEIGYPGAKIYGFLKGFEGIMHKDYIELNSQNTDEYSAVGGTILRTANKGDFGGRVGNNALRDIHSELVQNTLKSYNDLGLDCLFCIGGDGSMAGAIQFLRSDSLPNGINMICIPKSIDNDLEATDYTIGYASSLDIVNQSIENLKTTAKSHSRILVVEVMGRHTGHIALNGGIASGADLILLPEKGPKDIELVAESIYDKWQKKGYGIVVVAEAVRFKHVGNITKTSGSSNELLYGGVGEYLSTLLNERLEDRIAQTGVRKGMGAECRSVCLGHLQRAGSPNWFDKILAKKLAICALETFEKQNFGSIVTCKDGINGQYQAVEMKMENIVQKRVKITPEEIADYQKLGIDIM